MQIIEILCVCVCVCVCVLNSCVCMHAKLRWCYVCECTRMFVNCVILCEGVHIMYSWLRTVVSDGVVLLCFARDSIACTCEQGSTQSEPSGAFSSSKSEPLVQHRNQSTFGVAFTLL